MRFVTLSLTLLAVLAAASVRGDDLHTRRRVALPGRPQAGNADEQAGIVRGQSPPRRYLEPAAAHKHRRLRLANCRSVGYEVVPLRERHAVSCLR